MVATAAEARGRVCVDNEAGHTEGRRSGIGGIERTSLVERDSAAGFAETPVRHRIVGEHGRPVVSARRKRGGLNAHEQPRYEGRSKRAAQHLAHFFPPQNPSMWRTPPTRAAQMAT